MDSLVNAQIHVEPETFPTLCTFKGPLCGVPILVVLELRVHMKTICSCSASLGLLPVSILMGSELREIQKGGRTLKTLEGLQLGGGEQGSPVATVSGGPLGEAEVGGLPRAQAVPVLDSRCVRLHVQIQVCLLGKQLPAVRTLAAVLGSVDFLVLRQAREPQEAPPTDAAAVGLLHVHVHVPGQVRVLAEAGAPGRAPEGLLPRVDARVDAQGGSVAEELPALGTRMLLLPQVSLLVQGKV